MHVKVNILLQVFLEALREYHLAAYGVAERSVYVLPLQLLSK